MSDLSPEARRIIARAEGYDEPKPTDVERVYRSFRSRLLLGSAAATTALAARTALGGGAATKIAGGWTGLKIMGLVAGCVVAGAALTTALTGSNEVRQPAAEDVGEVEMPASGTRPPQVVVSGTPASRGKDPEPPARAPEVVGSGTASPATTSEQGVSLAGTAPPVGSAVPMPESLRAELAALGRARRALQEGRAEESLRVLRDRSVRYSALAPEREALEILALCRLGRPESSARARRFAQRHPEHPLVARLQEECPRRSAPRK